MTEEFEFISDGTLIRGMHSSAQNPRATVIFLTGDGTSGTQSSTWPSLTETMLLSGISACTFDFHSQGRSDGSRTKLTLKRAIRNFDDFLKYLDSNGIIQTTKLFCLGSSFGASVLLNTQHAFGRFQKISLKSPAFDLARAYDREMGNIEELVEWRTGGIHPELGLPFDAYEDAISSNGFCGLMKISCPVLITVGEKDEIVGVEDCVKAASLRPDIVALHVLPGVLHNYKQPGAKEAFERINAEFLGEGL